jgi:hypothetical protein
MTSVVFLDDGSVWERHLSKNKIKWIQKPNANRSTPLKEILGYFKTTMTYLPIDTISNLVNPLVIYSPGYPYYYMTDHERERHGYIQCDCCSIRNSCGKKKQFKSKPIIKLGTRIRKIVNV